MRETPSFGAVILRWVVGAWENKESVITVDCTNAAVCCSLWCCCDFDSGRRLPAVADLPILPREGRRGGRAGGGPEPSLLKGEVPGRLAGIGELGSAGRLLVEDEGDEDDEESDFVSSRGHNRNPQPEQNFCFPSAASRLHTGHSGFPSLPKG